jgi:hypothetical protein
VLTHSSWGNRELVKASPTQFELAANLKTANALGLAVPEAFLLRGDEVIE